MNILEKATEKVFCLKDGTVVAVSPINVVMYNKTNPVVSYTGTYSGFVNQHPELCAEVMELEHLVTKEEKPLRLCSYYRRGIEIDVQCLYSPFICALIADDEKQTVYIGEQLPHIKAGPYRSFDGLEVEDYRNYA